MRLSFLFLYLFILFSQAALQLSRDENDSLIRGSDEIIMTLSACAIRLKKNDKGPSDEFVRYFVARLKDEGLMVEIFDGDNEFEKTLIVRCDRIHLEKIAEINELLKLNCEGNMEPFVTRNSDAFSNYKSDDFFSPCEELYLLQEMILRVKTTSEFSKFYVSKFGSISEGDSLISWAEQIGLIEEIQPLHSIPQCKAVWNSLLFTNPFSIEYVNTIRLYYGAKVAMYFAWLHFFTQWLFIPGIFGFIIWIRNYVDSSVSVDNSQLVPIYTLSMIIWAAMFLRFWERKSATLSCEWGTTGFEEKDQIRSEFKGEIRVSPITGMKVRYFARRRRMLRYFVSAAVTIVMLCVAALFMVLSLNFQGYIHEFSYGNTYLHFHSFQQFSLPGAIFDQTGKGPYPWVLPLVPSIVHSIGIQRLNAIYSWIAKKLTENENHEMVHSYEYSFILKRFLFEAFDSYVALFYLAFLEADIKLLRSELYSLYTVSSLRRIFVECVLPQINYFLSSLKKRRAFGESKKSDEVKSREPLLEELDHDAYEPFDDYIEMVVEFGYIMLFAAASPLAASWSIAANLLESKSDLFKLCFLCKRPFVVRVDSIGIWFSLLKFIVWTSAITNVFIFGFTTEQMMQIFPWMFQIEESDHTIYGGEDHVHAAKIGEGRYVVGLIFLIEHVLILLIQLIFTVIPDIPGKVSIEEKRRKLKKSILMEEAKLQVIEMTSGKS